MNEYEQEAPPIVVDYFILGNGEVARISHDPVTGDDLGGEILVGSGRWEECPSSSIMGDGESVSRSEAKKWAKKLGLRL